MSPESDTSTSAGRPFVIDSWRKLNDLEEHLDVGDGFTTPYLFRGHESSAFRLTPTLHRAATLDGAEDLPDAAALLEYEKEVTLRFQQAAANFMSSSLLAPLAAPVDWWTVMRHYGAPTRLLDWTTSLFVATYFACRGEPTKDGSIYLLHVATFESAMRAIHVDAGALTPVQRSQPTVLEDPNSPSVIDVFRRKSAMPQRMVLQRGTFMICRNVTADVEAVLTAAMADYQDGPKEYFRKLTVPASAKPALMRRLRETNITAATLFPDLGGVCRALDEVVRARGSS
ncbi:MAG: FRG domain-containing protein [Gemmatimonadetes bacterium]|nr:FRG domain-containing protein [Gemmatimonadota bacterium]